jgi:hypothetical protein
MSTVAPWGKEMLEMEIHTNDGKKMLYGKWCGDSSGQKPEKHSIRLPFEA